MYQTKNQNLINYFNFLTKETKNDLVNLILNFFLIYLYDKDKPETIEPEDLLFLEDFIKDNKSKLI